MNTSDPVSAEAVDVGDATDGCGKPPTDPTPGNHGRASLISGLQREEWITYMPNGYRPDHRHPVLLVFHADGSTATEALRTTDLREFANVKNFIIVAPHRDTIVAFRDGVEPSLIERMLDQTRAELCVDSDRIFAFGTGGGGGGVEALTCSSWVVATATTSYRFNHERFLCENTRPVPTLYFAPLLSQHLPVKGGVTCGRYETIVPLATHDQMWRDRNLCKEPKREYLRRGKSVCHTWDCAEPYVSCHIDGGHAWKGHRRAIDVLKCDGPPADFPHLETMWRFFEEAVAR